MEIRLHGYVCKNSFVVSPLVCFPALSSWLHRSFKHLSFSYEPGQWHSRWYLESQSEYMKHIPLTQNYTSISDWQKRYFLYGGCARDAGWMAVTGIHCNWENHFRPKGSTYTNWNIFRKKN